MIIERTFASEALTYSLLGMGGFSFAFLGGRFFKFSEMLVERHIPFFSGIKVLLLLMPSFLVYVTPMSALLGILVVLSRMNAEGELLALKTSGMSPLRLLRPVLFVCTLASFLVFFLTLYGVPWATKATQEALFEAAKKSLIPQLKEKTFLSLTPKVVLYVEEIEGKDLKGIMLFDERDTQKTVTIVAKKARVIPQEETWTLSIELEQGEAFIKENQGHSLLRFQRYSFNFSPSELIEEVRRKSGFRLLEKEMSIRELRHKIEERLKEGKDVTPQLVELHLKWALPFSPFPLGFVGLCLGLYRTRAGKALGFVLSLLVVVLYYALYCLGNTLSTASLLPPWAGAWFSNFSLLGFSIWLLKRIREEKTLMLLDLIERGLEALKGRK